MSRFHCMHTYIPMINEIPPPLPLPPPPTTTTTTIPTPPAKKQQGHPTHQLSDPNHTHTHTQKKQGHDRRGLLRPEPRGHGRGRPPLARGRRVRFVSLRVFGWLVWWFVSSPALLLRPKPTNKPKHHSDTLSSSVTLLSDNHPNNPSHKTTNMTNTTTTPPIKTNKHPNTDTLSSSTPSCLTNTQRSQQTHHNSDTLSSVSNTPTYEQPKTTATRSRT